ncbi:hypothetical protein N7448_009383 [Penicillium atrosanguineum]|uniref:Altered inheritance of mitochondria protein 6 n=1 Tax=Penicillium atrosanguineum TaxID=1132637 RepID=A0A9W9U5T9_9EURO|nr:hypothetical protein N7448_009383 [Penicillium atrosanguineum]KAJ5141918.1 hypothetical protein N7526_002913 [Penicillium atrosanguineum]KAJ5321221.1 hypothetical protein N7476_004223 [Penicillium atrosanguineum]
MRSYQPEGTQSSSTSECLLEVPFEVYTDSPDSDVNKAPRVQAVPRAAGPPNWRQRLTSYVPFASREDALPLLSENNQRSRCCSRSSRSRFSRGLVRTLLVFFVMLGIIQFISLACGIVLSFFPDEYDRAAHVWSQGDSNLEDITHWPTDTSRDIIPKGCHSHNDYWRRVPLFSALQAGCIGVEADVWLFDEELYVGHTRSALTSRRTLRSMYVDPLVKILERQNPITPFHRAIDHPPHGVWDTDPDQSVILLIDFKTDGAATYPAVVKQLAPLRERGYLTYFNGREVIPGPVTVVGTGNAPFDLISANSTYRDIFFDAPLDKLVDDSLGDQYVSTTRSRDLDQGQGNSGMPETINSHTFNLTNSYYASVSFKKAIGFPWPFHFSQHQMELIRAQVRVAHHHGLKVRYWGLPSWPRSLRNHIWRILAQEGIDMLNVDDLLAATKGEWRIQIFDWWI